MHHKSKFLYGSQCCFLNPLSEAKRLGKRRANVTPVLVKDLYNNQRNRHSKMKVTLNELEDKRERSYSNGESSLVLWIQIYIFKLKNT